MFSTHLPKGNSRGDVIPWLWRVAESPSVAFEATEPHVQRTNRPVLRVSVHWTPWDTPSSLGSERRIPLALLGTNPHPIPFPLQNPPSSNTMRTSHLTGRALGHGDCAHWRQRARLERQSQSASEPSLLRGLLTGRD